MHHAFIALGSNLGKRQLALRTALRRLNEIRDTRLVTSATFFQTAPVDAPPGSPDFFNSAAHLETALSPGELFASLVRIEEDLGRRRDPTLPPNAPRTIDLDLLLFDQEVLALPNLTIPHPRMHLRRFVLAPLEEIAPEAVHPTTGKTIRELLADLNLAGPPGTAPRGVDALSSGPSGDGR